MLNKITSILKLKPVIDEADIIASLEEHQFIRYVMYLDVLEFIKNNYHKRKIDKPKIIEFGGSNGYIKRIFNNSNYEVADNFPIIDVTDLSLYRNNTYDFVIMDQVLEHVSNPYKAINEIHRILKKDGWLINTTPFLIQIHNVPNDYWRFTKEGLRELCSIFSKNIVKSWGNKETAIYHIQHNNWPSTAEMREMDNFNIENEDAFPYIVWNYSQK